MDPALVQVHLAAGRAYGREATCGTKVNYQGEERATRSAAAMSVKFERRLEAYPCVWCDGWHIGRAMTRREYGRFAGLPWWRRMLS